MGAGRRRDSNSIHVPGTDELVRVVMAGHRWTRARGCTKCFRSRLAQSRQASDPVKVSRQVPAPAAGPHDTHADPRVTQCQRQLFVGRPAESARLIRWRSVRGVQYQCGGIQAVTLSGRRRAIRKDVAEVRITCLAQHFGPDHSEARVRAFRHTSLGKRSREARPSRTGVKLRI